MGALKGVCITLFAGLFVLVSYGEAWAPFSFSKWGGGSTVFTVLDDDAIVDDDISSSQARRGLIITNAGKGGAADYNIPAGKAGMVVYVFSEEAQVIVLDLANSGDTIYLPSGIGGLTAGNAIDSDGVFATSITLVCHAGTGTGDGHWYVHSQVGVWSDGGAN